ncbi:hypothetical protein AgCh_001562 [Apium graveolens]
MEVDHYVVLGLPSGIQSTKLSLQDITKAYRLKALQLHPDKRRHDPDAHNKFQRLLYSYEILKDTKTRNARNEERVKMRKERELAAEKAREEEERRNVKMRAELKKKKELEVERRRHEMMVFLKRKELAEKQARDEIAKFLNDGHVALEGKNVVTVSWDKSCEDYSAQRLRELFQEFGEVRYVLIRSCETNKGSAFIVMASEDAGVAATRSVVGNLGNPLIVLPVLRPVAVAFPIAQRLSRCSAIRTI